MEQQEDSTEGSLDPTSDTKREGSIEEEEEEECLITDVTTNS